MMKKQGTYAVLRNLAAKIEDDFGLKVAIVHQQSGFQTSGHQRKTYSLLCLAFLSDHDRGECERRFSAMRESFVFDYHPEYTLQYFYLDSPKVWQDGNPMRAARAECWGYLLMEKVVYGEEKIEILRRAAREELGEDIFDRWRVEHRRWRWRCVAKVRRANRRIRHVYATCKEVLNKRERDQIVMFLQDVLLAYEGGRRVFIGIDGSGRPLAKMADWFLRALGHEDIELYFLDPHGFKGRHSQVERLAGVILEQQPLLYQKLTICSEQCLLIEDQIGYGGQSEFLFLVMRHIAGEQHAVKMLAMSQWAEDNPPPSWYQNYQLMGIAPVKNGVDGIVAGETETPESVEFYRRLEMFALGVAKKY